MQRWSSNDDLTLTSEERVEKLFCEFNAGNVSISDLMGELRAVVAF